MGAVDSDTAGAGTAAQCQQKSSTSVVVVQCSVGATGSGEDIELSSVNISAGDTVQITSLTYAAPP